MRQRILAALGALALVAAAIVLRATVFDHDGSGGSGRGGSRPVVACTKDLASVCDALAAAGRIAADPPTLDLDGAAAPPADLDGWITWDPAPGIVNLDAPGTWASSRPLGGADLALATRTVSPLVLPSGCAPAAPTWACLARAALDDGLGLGIGPATTAESLARFAPLAASLVPADGDARDLSGNDLDAILDGPNAGQAPFARQFTQLRTQVGSYDAVVGPAGAVDGTSGIRSTTPTPAATVTVVVAVRSGDAARFLTGAESIEAVAKALRAAGVEPGTGRLSDTAAGLLAVVREKVG